MNWYEKAFCQNYLEVYAHRTDEQAQAEVAFANQHLHFSKQQTVLDLCCGAGRHAFALSPFVGTVVGFDLSSDLLSCAVKENLTKKCTNIFWQKGDMLKLDFYHSFDSVVCFFNSFGYFESEKENNQVIQNIFRALKPNGIVLMDLMNKPFIINQLIPESQKKINQYTIKEIRSISPDGLRVEKEVKVYEDKKLINDYKESVRLYNKDELRSIFKIAGFKPLELYGNISNDPLREDSHRLILIGQKP